MKKEITYYQNEISLDSLPEDQQSLINDHLTAVLKENQKFNLTSITSFEEGRLLHIEDSLVGLPEIMKAPEGKYADIGSGAGFPGIPLAIATKRNTVLVEAANKKAKFLKEITSGLTLDYITVSSARVEELALSEREEYSVITARALTSLSSLIELASPLLSLEGQLVAYKANPQEQEVEESRIIEDKIGMRLISSRGVLLSDGKTKRCIFLYEKYKEPEVKLPRRPGMAQKRPYKK